MIACSDSQNQASKLNQLQMTNHRGNHNSSHIYHKDKVITNIDPWNKEFPLLHGKNVSRQSSRFLLLAESVRRAELVWQKENSPAFGQKKTIFKIEITGFV